MKVRKLAVPYSTVFIHQLPEGTQNIIRKDLESHAREHGYRLEYDMEAKDYVAMSRRFCDMDDIYMDTHLKFCREGEDIVAYQESIRRTITLELPEDDLKAICQKAGGAGLKVSELLENFIEDLVYSSRNNGSDERMYANQWFDRCWFGMGFHKSFLGYLIEMDESEAFIDAWEDLEEYKQQKEFDRYEREDMESLEGYIKRAYENYKESCEVKQDSFEEDMKIVLDWYAEVEKMEEGTKEKARDKERCSEEGRRIIK